jgi:hypothetical protein
VRALILSTIIGYSAFNGHAQTVLINPNTDGGFEQGPPWPITDGPLTIRQVIIHRAGF